MMNDHVIRMVGSASRVLEILGGSNHDLISALSDSGRRHVVGLESDLAVKKSLGSICAASFHADLNSNDWPHLLDEHDKFDAIVALDVAGRLLDPWVNLQRMSGLLSPTGCVVLSLPNIGHASVAASLLQGRFPYSESGLLNRAYLRFFGLNDIRQLVTAASLKVVELIDFCAPAEGTELAEYWTALGSERQRVLSHFERSNVHTVLIKAVPLHHPQPEVEWPATVRKTETDSSQIALESMGRDLGNARTANDQLMHQLATSQTALMKANETVAAILGSSSWKLTAPLRALKRLFG